MKRINLLIPSLVVVTASPFIGLTSCFENEEDDPKPGPTPPIPEESVVVEQWNPKFLGYNEEDDPQKIVTGAILTSTQQTYKSDTKYSFAIKFQHEQEFFKYPYMFSFRPSLDGKSYSKKVFLFNNVEIYVNTVDNKLDMNKDYGIDKTVGAIMFLRVMSEKLQKLKNDDVIFIETTLTPGTQAAECYFALHACPMA